MAPRPFLILETGQPAPALRRYGGFPHWIRVAAGLRADDTVVVNVAHGEPLPERHARNGMGFAGALITGSAAMVTERRDWSERAAEWLREAAHAGTPLFGICYGHQLLAHALGGEVGDNPAGREMGTISVALRPEAKADALFGALPDAFAAQASHLQSVLAPPDGAKVLATSAKDAVQAFSWGENAWGVQFHPEWATNHMREYLHARRMALIREGSDPKQMRRDVAATPHARGLLGRFVRRARGHA